MDANSIKPSLRTSSGYKHGSLTLIKSLREEILLVELAEYIKLTALVRKTQKEYYREHDSQRKKTLLINCKTLEARQEKEGNRIWVANKLGAMYFKK